MGDDEEPGSENVTARTRAFEEIDAQVGGPSLATVEAYRCMFDRVVKHALAHSEQ
jgi:hypothetical protein